MNQNIETIAGASLKLKNRECSAVELSEEYLERIKEKDSEVGAYLEVFEDVLEQAKEADRVLGKGEGGALTGIPIAVKDNILIKGRVSSAGSKILEEYTATYNATAISKLKGEGAVLLGRTNMDEFAMGSSTEHSAFKKTRNPHDKKRVPGGSSGGSAAAVSMGGALGALGSDTGGSIRQPASFCGVVGLKPTYGTVSRFGLTALGSSLDVIGPLANTVADTELLYNVISGKDLYDGTSRDASLGESSVRNIGVPRNFLEKGMDKGVEISFEKMLSELRSAGYNVIDVDLPSVEYALSVYYIVMPAEASSNLARFDGVKYGLYKEGETLLGDYTSTRGSGFGKEVRRRILLGTYILSSGYYDAYYVKAGHVRNAITRDFHTAFDNVDVIVTPTTPTPAFLFDEKNDPISMYLADIFTVPANLTGMPAISVPMGHVTENNPALPVGFQIIAPHFGEGRLFSLGNEIEKMKLCQK